MNWPIILIGVFFAIGFGTLGGRNMIEFLLFTGILLGFELLGFGAHSLIYDGFRYAIPWFVAWFIIHGCTFKESLVKIEEEIIMEKFILGFMAAWAFTFIFTGIFYKIELSCADGSTSRKIFNVITTVMANIVWLSPFIFAIAGCLFNFITVIAALIIIVVYIIITAVIGQFLSK